MTKFKNLKQGEVLSESHYYKVVKKVGNQVQLVNDNEDNIVVDSDYVNSSLSSSSQFDEEKRVTKTELAQLFLDHSRIAMTVMFNKKLDPKMVTKEASDIYNDLTFGMTQANFAKRLKRAINLKGEERIMVGRHYGNPDVNGRVFFVDMNIEKGNPNRLVDPRTINYLVVDNVKYILK